MSRREEERTSSRPDPGNAFSNLITRFWSLEELAEALVSNVELVIADATELKVTHADKVLIDAPCSNSGTMNVDPSIPLHLTKAEVQWVERARGAGTAQEREEKEKKARDFQLDILSCHFFPVCFARRCNPFFLFQIIDKIYTYAKYIIIFII